MIVKHVQRPVVSKLSDGLLDHPDFWPALISTQVRGAIFIFYMNIPTISC